MGVDYLQRISVDFDKSNKQKVIDLFKEYFDLTKQEIDDDILEVGDDYLYFEIFNRDLGEDSVFIQGLKSISESVSVSEFAFCDDSSFTWNKDKLKDEI